MSETTVKRDQYSISLTFEISLAVFELVAEVFTS